MANSASEGTTKAMVADQISQAVLSTSNLLHLMQESSPAQSLVKLPKNLLGKVPNIKSTGQALEQMPHIISSLDAHLDSALQSASQLHTVRCLLVNRETSAAHVSYTDADDSVTETQTAITESG
eukprot:Gb_05529 [translate_table: standard]